MKSSMRIGLDAKMVKELEKEFSSMPLVRNKIKEILEKKALEHYEKLCKENTLDSPNYALKQAEGMGYIRGIKEIITFLE